MTGLTISNPKSNEKRHLDPKFSSDELVQLRDYVTFAQQLVECGYFKEKRHASLQMCWDKTTGIKVTPYLPPPDTCDSLLLRLRPFVLENEPTSFTSVCSILGRGLSDPQIHTLLRSQRDLWEGKYFRAMIKVSDDCGILNSDRTLMDYLNAFEYHRDREKRTRLQGAHKLMGDKGIRAFYFLLLAEKAVAIINTAALCRCILGDTKELKLSFERPIRDAN